MNLETTEDHIEDYNEFEISESVLENKKLLNFNEKEEKEQKREKKNKKKRKKGKK
jgi:hypothetical protein